MTMQTEEFQQALQSLNRLEVERLMIQARQDHTPLQCVEGLVLPALKYIGDGWEQGSVALSQVYMSGRICEALVDTILPPTDPAREGQLVTAIVTLDDYHMLGKRIVYSVLRSSGYKLLDYGRCTVDELIRKLIQDKVEILLVSVLMLPSALRVKDLKEKLMQNGIDVKIIVGGAPFRFDADLWKEVGADAMGADALEAMQIIAQMTGGQS